MGTRIKPVAVPSMVAAKAIARRWRAWVFQAYLVAATAAFGILFVLAGRFSYFPIDLSITRGVQAIDAAWFLDWMRAVSFSGYWPQVFIVIAAVVLSLYAIGLRWNAEPRSRNSR